MQIIKLKSHKTIPVNYTGIAEYPNGSKQWYLNGERHRVDGPASEYPDGSKSWYLNGNRHRVDGPALEWADGTKKWYLNNQLHREHGPAIEWDDDSKEWWVNGKFLFSLWAEDQPFLVLEETGDQVKILTATETKWIKNVPGLKELEGKSPCK